MNVKHTIYNSLIRSHIWYNVSCWGKSKSKDIDRIVVLQKRAVRYIANLKYNAHTGKSFKNLNILQFDDLVNLNQASFMYRYVNKKLPSSFDTLLDKLGNFERSLALQLPRVNKTALKILPSFAMIKLWNELSLDLRS